ncbi:MAG TPA: hypothetical protein VEB18_00245 [Candidatus Paceibacterota bacterium]|nr:hypothetical protein [Candidatus Paceibacterota bacterium]
MNAERHYRIPPKVEQFFALLLIALVGVLAALLIVRAHMYVRTQLEDAHRSDDVDYGLQRLEQLEQQRLKAN